MPTSIKDAIAQALFDNLRVCGSYIGMIKQADPQVPSISFTPSSLLALAACGRITGLDVDCGWLETTVTPVCPNSLFLGFKLINRFSIRGRSFISLDLHHWQEELYMTA
jgi:hypothetical protein